MSATDIHWEVRLCFANYNCLGTYENYNTLYFYIYELTKVVKKAFAWKKPNYFLKAKYYNIHIYFKCH